MRSVGRLGARVGGNTELIEGVMEGIDPALIAEIINQNTGFLMGVMSNVDLATLLRSIDQEVLKGILDEALDIFVEDVTLLDLDKVVDIINGLDYTRMGEMLMKIDPNILGIALGIMLWSFRKATVTPGIFTADESMETLDITPDMVPDRKTDRKTDRKKR